MTNPNEILPEKKSKTTKEVFADAGKNLGSSVAHILKFATSIIKTTVKSVSGPVPLIAGAIAWFKTPAFVGGVGILKSLAVGAGTSLFSGLGVVVGMAGGVVGGGIIGGLMGRLAGRGGYSVIGALMGATLGGFGGSAVGGVYGLFKGYDISKEYMLKEFPKKFENGQNTIEFNKVAPKAPEQKQLPAPGVVYKLAAPRV